MASLADVPTPADGRIAVVGTGFIGRSWAIVFARAGFNVTLYDASASQCESARGYIGEMLPELAKAGLLNGNVPDEVMERIATATDLAGALDGAFYVQENAPEQLELKRSVFAELGRLTDEQAILASSTSAILPSRFSGELPCASRCLVVHPINPPHLVPSVEVVPGQDTAPEVVVRTAALMRAVGQSTVVMHKEIDGFIVNRLQGALLHEAFRLFEGGYADMESIDICVRDGLGLRWSFMGPFETIDLNAPGGIKDYIRRYGPFYRSLWPDGGALPDWSASEAQAERERSQQLPRGEMLQRQGWRDRKLIELAATRHNLKQDR